MRCIKTKFVSVMQSFEAVADVPVPLRELPNTVIDLQVQSAFAERTKPVYEAALTLQLTGRTDTQVLWRIQLQQAGLYQLQGFQEEQRQAILNTYCLNHLYPYASVAVTQMVVQGGFSPIYLSPMNFDALYQERQKQAAEQAKQVRH